MTTELYSKNFTGRESDQDLNCLISEYLNPKKIKQLRFVFIMKKRGERRRLVECFQLNGVWFRCNWIDNKYKMTKEGSFEELIKRTRATLELPRNLVDIEKFRLVVYGDK